MIYEYENSKGTRRTIVAPMSRVPPERVVFALGEIEWSSVPEGWTDDNPLVFRRIYTTGAGYVNRFSAWRSPVTGKGVGGALDKGYSGP